MENIAIVEDIPPFEYREGFNGILKYSENGIYWHYEQAIIANNVSAEEFLDMAFNWCVDGLDNKEYYTNPKHNAPRYYDSYFDDVQLLQNELGYNVKYHEFYSDGLRFSTSVNFS